MKPMLLKTRAVLNLGLNMGLAAILVFVLSGAAMAKDLPQAPFLPLDAALKAASAALTQCEKDGYRVSVAVVDRGGVLKVLLRADGTGPHTVGSSTRKAYTSASMGRSTNDLAKAVASNPELDGLRNMDPQILILAGGLPIVINDTVVGGIGVGGAPGGNLDEACAQAGIDTLNEYKK